MHTCLFGMPLGSRVCEGVAMCVRVGVGANQWIEKSTVRSRPWNILVETVPLMQRILWLDLFFTFRMIDG